jgi:hypothetical protein
MLLIVETSFRYSTTIFYVHQGRVQGIGSYSKFVEIILEALSRRRNQASQRKLYIVCCTHHVSSVSLYFNLQKATDEFSCTDVGTSPSGQR